MIGISICGPLNMTMSKGSEITIVLMDKSSYFCYYFNGGKCFVQHMHYHLGQKSVCIFGSASVTSIHTLNPISFLTHNSDS